MAQPSNSFSSYDAIGNREDLSDIIYDVSPTETPFLTAIPKVSATSTKHEWQKDALTAASSSNFVIEGDDATTDAVTATTRAYNYCAISDKVARVTGTQEVVNKAGRRSEMAYQIDRRAKELKRDIEKILLENNASVVGTDTAARECAGAQAWIVTNADDASDATAATGDGTDAHTDGTARALTETMVESVLASAWTNGGTPSLGIMNSFQKRKFSGFAGNATRQSMATEKKITNTIDVYIDPLGNEVRLVPDRYAPTDVVYFFDPEYAAYAVLRDFQTSDLAKTGDSERKQILCEYTLEMRNEAAHGAIYDLSAS
jgi:hypothetical protein